MLQTQIYFVFPFLQDKTWVPFRGADLSSSWIVVGHTHVLVPLLHQRAQPSPYAGSVTHEGHG
jgi:hypothetical protein